MSKKITKTKLCQPQDVSQDFLAPIIIEGQLDSDPNALARQLQHEREVKLAALLEHYNISVTDPASVLTGVMQLACDFVPGFTAETDFELPLKKRKSRPRQNTLEHDAMLCMMREQEALLGGERGAPTRAARRAAVAEIKSDKRRLTRVEINRRAKTHQNRLSQFRDDEWRAASRQLLEKYFSQQFKKE